MERWVRHDDGNDAVEIEWCYKAKKNIDFVVVAADGIVRKKKTEMKALGYVDNIVFIHKNIGFPCNKKM